MFFFFKLDATKKSSYQIGTVSFCDVYRKSKNSKRDQRNHHQKKSKSKISFLGSFFLSEEFLGEIFFQTLFLIRRQHPIPPQQNLIPLKHWCMLSCLCGNYWIHTCSNSFVNKNLLPPGRLTWLAGKAPFLIGDTSSKRLVSHCHVSFPGCTSHYTDWWMIEPGTFKNGEKSFKIMGSSIWDLYE